ncbi:MAG: hypothetical protein RLZZ450_3480 [Pseudomonadota bacterium]|jgi:TolA-binding protein
MVARPPGFARHAWLAVALCALPLGSRADAPAAEAVPVAGTQGQPAPVPKPGAVSENEDTAVSLLRGHLALLEQKRLAPTPAESVDELDALLQEAHQRALAGSKDEAAMLLLEAVEGPRFRTFESFPSFAAADLALASLLLDQRALLAAQRSVDRLLARGRDTPTFGPAYRRAVDIALARGDYQASADSLGARVEAPLSEDATNELHYLRGLAADAVHDDATAQRELAAITQKSRFYGNAQYLLGATAARQKKYDEASAHFCAVRDIATGPSRTRYESGPRFATEDAAQLGLGRVAHEQGRHKEAFEQFSRVPNDSPLVAEALFESAYASYEQGHPRTSLDTLDQLEARFVDSAYTAEARVLRGYVHLSSCDFVRAEGELVQFENTFGGVLRELDATLASPQRTRSLFLERERGTRASASSHDALLLGLVKRDPNVERLRTALDALDAELARSSHTGQDFAALSMRVRGKELPAARPREDSTDEASRIERLRQQSEQVHQAISGVSRELSALRGDRSDERTQVTRLFRQLEKRSDALDASLRALARKSELQAERPSGAVIGDRLDQDGRYVEAVRTRAMRVREELEAELSRAEREALEVLRERLQKELRRARIGRIDAVMGKKRKLELEVESLAAGRFPAELASSKRKPALLSDDEEYWPFEGEDWPDEFEERP